MARIMRGSMQLTTTLAAAMIFASQAMLPFCLCSAATARIPSCELSCCRGHRQHAAGGAPSCICSATLQSIPAPASEKFEHVDLPRTSDLIQPLAGWAPNLGLHGVDWHTAVNLMAVGNPPRLRLHALFSVWRN